MRSFRLNVGTTVQRGGRLQVIDELKGLAIALVILYHSCGVLGCPNYAHGEIGVDIFLLVSGFTLALSASDQPLGQFVIRRGLRIYPAYWIALALFLVTHRIFFGAHYPAGDVIAHVVGYHAFSRLAYFSDICDAFWFISLILAAYGVFALVRRRLDDLSLLIALCGVLTTLASVAYLHFNHTGGLISLAVRIPSFFAGVIAGRLLGSGTAEVRLNFTLGIGLACFYYLVFFRDVAPNYTLPAIGLLLVWVALRRPLASFAAGRTFLRLVAVLGIFSYEIYLFHQPIIRDYNRLFFARVFNILEPSRLLLGAGILGGLAVTGVIAFAVHHLTDLLFHRFAKKPPTVDPSSPVGNAAMPLPLC